MAGISYLPGFAAQPAAILKVPSLETTVLQDLSLAHEQELQYSVNARASFAFLSRNQENAGTMNMFYDSLGNRLKCRSEMQLKGYQQINLESRVDADTSSINFSTYHDMRHKYPMVYINPGGKKFDMLSLVHYLRSGKMDGKDYEDVEFVFRDRAYPTRITRTSSEEVLETPVGKFLRYDKYSFRMPDGVKFRWANIYVTKDEKRYPFLIEQKVNAGVADLQTRSHLTGIIHR